jgi:pSer/pThr/pTyr-binding forkhead associated (FHA) protein
MVSRRHARLRVQSGHLRIEDLGSLNGTRVDGEESVPGAPLRIRDGSTLALGDVVLTANFLAEPADEAKENNETP